MTTRRSWMTEGTTLRVVMYAPDRATKTIVTDYVAMKASRLIYEQGSFSITTFLDSPVCTAVNPDTGYTAWTEEWLEWSFDVYWRGTLLFSGPVTSMEARHDGRRGTAVVELTAEPFFEWILTSRMIETDTGAMWGRNDTPWDDIWRDLVRDQCVNGTGTPVAPPEYPATVNRYDFGSFTVTVEADSSSASNGDFWIQSGKPLKDTLVELCSTAPTDADMLWPTVTETAPGTFEFGVDVGRSGGSRGIGADKSSTVVLTGYRGSVSSFRKRVEHKMMVSVARVGGAGRGASQRRRYVVDSDVAVTKKIVREDGVTIPAGTTNEDLDNEARRALWEQKLDNVRSFEFVLVEEPGITYGTSWNLKDTVTAHDIVTGETVSRMVMGVEVTMASPGPPVLKVIFGKPPRNSVRDAQRSGGGGRGGGRGGGGAPRDNDGQPVEDPDTMKFWSERCHNDGNSTYADEVGDLDGIVGEEDYDVVRAYTMGIDVGSTAGTRELSGILIEGTPDVWAGGDPAYSHFMWIRGDDGNIYRFLVSQLGPANVPAFACGA